MPQRAFLDDIPAVAQRQAKTDRLILAKLLEDAVYRTGQNEEAVQRGHEILVKWADLETSGRLASLNETQLQGDFLGEVFGEALGYQRAVDNAEKWQLVQHPTFGSQTPDAALGQFEHDKPLVPLAVIELKGPRVHLDRDRAAGRTAVDQCWDYLVNTPPECRWGIVSNMVSFRLYERNSTKRAYEHFTLQSLREFKVYRRFHTLFNRYGLIEKSSLQPQMTADLVKATLDRQTEVGDKLYEEYSEHRLRFIRHLYQDLKHGVDESVEYAQRLLDRVIFIAFCEDRGLLPPGTIHRAYEDLPAFTAVTNPRWQNFKTLFHFLDKGGPARPDQPNGRIPAYNGGLFAESAADDLELDDSWTEFFKHVGSYDFADEVNLDVLGNLFERSITELEKLKTTGVVADAEKAEQYATMPQSAKRKRLGIYYTPPELTSRIVQYTVEELIAERFAVAAVDYGISDAEARRGIAPDDADYWRTCLDILRNLKIVDPACGSGAFLFQAYNVLELRYHEVIGHLEQTGATDAEELADQVPQFILQDNLYGVDLSPEAVEITQLALWIRSATPGQTLAKLSENIVHGNSLVHDPEVHPAGFDWRERFADVFDREESGFDCVIGNPPWERIKLQEREFFSLPAPEIATASNAAKRRTLVAKLESDDPALYERYQEALEGANALLTYCRKSKAYPLTGKGDINTYAVFAELAYKLVAPHGLVGLLTPSGIASDKTTKDFFAAIAETNRLRRLYDFENKKVFFPEVHASFKFCILNFAGEEATVDEADFAFFIHRMEQLEEPDRHIRLSGADIKLLNPNTRTCPIFRSRRDAEITKAIYRRVPVLVDKNREGPTGDPWGIDFKRMFDQTNDAELFREPDELQADGFKLFGNRWKQGKQVCLPLYEAKMFRPYDHRHGSAFTNESVWFQQGHTTHTTLVEHQNPEFEVIPRWWTAEVNVIERQGLRPALLAFRNIARATDTRTMIPCFIPFAGVVNSAPFIRFGEGMSWRTRCGLLANLYAFPLDFVVRGKLGGTNLNFFIVEQLPVLPPDTYTKPCPWSRDETLESWISERVLKLTCTAEDMLPLAEACDFTGGSFRDEYGGRLNKWDEAERAHLMAELDAAYFHLYGIVRDDAEYILSTFKGIHDPNDLLPARRTTAEHVLAVYEELGN